MHLSFENLDFQHCWEKKEQQRERSPGSLTHNIQNKNTCKSNTRTKHYNLRALICNICDNIIYVVDIFIR